MPANRFFLLSTAVVLLGLVGAASPAAAADSRRECQAIVVLDNADAFVAVSHLLYELRYPAASVEVAGTGDAVECVGCVAGSTDRFDDDDAGTVEVSFDYAAGRVFGQIAACRVRVAEGAGAGSFSVVVREASQPSGASATANVFVADLVCSGDQPAQCMVPVTTTTTIPTATTTTTVSAPTTTTIPLPPAMCGDADGNGVITASDALAVLRAAVGVISCPLPVCDVDGDGAIKVNDGLRVLRAAVGMPETLTCS